MTVTLPVDVLTALHARDPDIGRAIVGLFGSRTAAPAGPPAVSLYENGPKAVIVVRPVAALRRLPGVDLVSLGDPERALIAFKDPLTVAAFELRVQDLLDGPPLPAAQAQVIAALAALLREVRRTPGRRLSEERIIVLEGASRRRPGTAPGRGAGKRRHP